LLTGIENLVEIDHLYYTGAPLTVILKKNFKRQEIAQLDKYWLCVQYLFIPD